MNVIIPGDDGTACGRQSRSVSTRRLDRVALAVSAAERRAQLQEIKAGMESACDNAVRRSLPDRDGDRSGWDRHAWAIYTQEALVQFARHAEAIARLQREARHLDHIAAWAS